MKTHSLKIESNYLDRIIDGSKQFEVRFNDRDFQVGDRLYFHESNIKVEITYILHSFIGLKEGYVVLGIKLL